MSRVETTLREMRDLGLRRPPALVFHEYDFVCLTRNCLCLGARWNFAVPMYILIVTNSFLERRLVWRRRYGFRTDLTNFPLVIITKNYDGPAQGYTSRSRRMRAQFYHKISTLRVSFGGAAPSRTQGAYATTCLWWPIVWFGSALMVTSTCTSFLDLTSLPRRSFNLFSIQNSLYRSSQPSISISAFSGSSGCSGGITFLTVADLTCPPF